MHIQTISVEESKTKKTDELYFQVYFITSETNYFFIILIQNFSKSVQNRYRILFAKKPSKILPSPSKLPNFRNCHRDELRSYATSIVLIRRVFGNILRLKTNFENFRFFRDNFVSKRFSYRNVFFDIRKNMFFSFFRWIFPAISGL